MSEQSQNTGDMLKVIAPFRALFNLDSSKIASQPAAFMDFLGKLRGALDDPKSALASKISPALDVEINLLKTAAKSDNTRDHGRSYLLPQVFTLRFRPSYRAELESIYARAAAEADKEVEKYAAMFRPDFDTLAIRFNDNTVAILSLDLGIDRAKLVTGRESWNRMNDWSGALVKHMLRELYPALIFPLLRGLIDFSNHAGEAFVSDVPDYKIFFVLVGDPANPYPDLQNRFIPMKTNLTLCTSGGDEETHWVTNITRHGVSVRLKETEIQVSDENNRIVAPRGVDRGSLEFFWELVASASYYYIAMNVINVNLIRYIGITGNKHSHEALRVITRDTENIINSVTILKVRYNDLLSELTGTAKAVFQAFQKEWNFRNITDNMQSKLDLCRTNIKTLNVEMQRRNQGRIETVLTGVAGMSVMSVFVELGCYATQMPKDNLYMVGKLPGFMDLGFIMSGNALSWIGIAIAVSVLAFTIRHRSG